MSKTTINKSEVAKFSAIADEWWDKEGKFKPLHKFSPVRMDYILKQICQIKDLDFYSKKPLHGLKILDIGCGGGLVAEPLDKMGATVTAIDPSEKNIKTALAHQLKSKSNVNYLCSSIEELDKKSKFDIITCLEVIEHVDNYQFFLNQLQKHLKPKGIVFLATINRTVKSLCLAKFAAEYVLRWLPRGTHDWQKFLKPSELVSCFSEKSFKLNNLQGVKFNLLKNSWEQSKDLSQNYILSLVKK